MVGRVGGTHDLSRQIATVRGDTASRWDVRFGVDWRVLGTFAPNFDDTIVDLAGSLGLTLTSEDEQGFRTYSVSGPGTAILALLEPINTDLNERSSMPFRLTGSKRRVADAQFKIAERCAEMGLQFRPTVYSSLMSATLVAEVTGPLADVVTLLWDARDAVNRALGRPEVRAPRPPHGRRTAPPERGVA